MYLERGIALARQVGRPYLEFTGLAYLALDDMYHSFARADEHGRQAVELAERHGWTGDPVAGVACAAVGLAGVAGELPRRQSPGPSAPRRGRRPRPHPRPARPRQDKPGRPLGPHRRYSHATAWQWISRAPRHILWSWRSAT